MTGDVSLDRFLDAERSEINHPEIESFQLPDLPKGWIWRSLEEVVHINKESRNPSVANPSQQFIYIDISSIEGGTGRIKEIKKMIGRDAPSRARRVVHTNDVLMSTVRPYLKSFAVVPKDYENQICSTGFAVLTCKEEILPKYLLYSLFLDVVINQCNSLMKGAHYPAINAKQVKKIMIPFSPINIQKNVITRIEETIDRLEQMKKLKEEVLTDTESIMQSALRKVFDNGHKRGWNQLRLNDVVKLKSGQFLPSKEFKVEGSYLVYGGNGVVGRYDKYIFEEPKVVIGRVGAKCGCVCISSPKSWITDNALFVDEKLIEITDEYLEFALRNLDLNKYANQAAQPVISGKRIYPIKIFVPSAEGQEHVVSYLKSIQEKAMTLEEVQQESLRQIKELRQSIIEEAFLG